MSNIVPPVISLCDSVDLKSSTTVFLELSTSAHNSVYEKEIASIDKDPVVTNLKETAVSKGIIPNHSRMTHNAKGKMH